jgi:Ca2+-binding RTX toxin-like protein
MIQLISVPLGQDTVFSTVNYTLAANVENLYLTGAANGTGNNEANLISGYFGVNNHAISGLEGNDTLIGGIARDQLSGGADDDIYGVYNSSTVVIENANEGNDTVWATVDFSLTANVENLYLVGDTTGVGNDLANIMVGYGTGNNTIDGGAGADNLWGGAGADTFVLRNPNDGIDTINDFEAGTDKFNLVGASFGGNGVVGAAGVLAAAKFITGTAATTTDQRFIYDNTAGALYFDADGSAAGTKIQIAQLVGNPVLTATSFVIS